MRETGLEIPNRDADALRAEIKGQYRSGTGVSGKR
jgi:hypothetical protein